MALVTRIRHLGGRSFALPGDDQIFVTNKFSILSGPEAWVTPVRLSSLRLAMAQAGASRQDKWDPIGTLEAP
jgi:hypothetical protein